MLAFGKAFAEKSGQQNPWSVFNWEHSRLIWTRLLKYGMKAVFPHHKVCLLRSAFHQSLNMKVILRRLAKKPQGSGGFSIHCVTSKDKQI